VRPKKSFLEVCVFLGRAVKAPQVRRVEHGSKSKVVNIIQIRHRDEVEAPITDWLQEAYDYSMAPKPVAKKKPAPVSRKKSKVVAKKKARPAPKKKAGSARKAGAARVVKRR
jgi:hypothetical protein